MMRIIGTLFPLCLLISHNNVIAMLLTFIYPLLVRLFRNNIGMVYLTLDTQAFNACTKENLAAVLDKMLSLKGV